MRKYRVSIPCLTYFDFMVEAVDHKDALTRVLERNITEAAELDQESAAAYPHLIVPAHEPHGAIKGNGSYWPLIMGLDEEDNGDWYVDGDQELMDRCEQFPFEVKTYPEWKGGE